MSSLAVAFAGTLSVSREDFEKLLTQSGASVCQRVTSKTTHFVCGTGGEKTAKHLEAKRLGIAILLEDDFRNVLKAPASGAAASSRTQNGGAPAAKKKKTSPPLEGMTICISGKLSQPKADITKKITDGGGQVCASVTKACTHLLASGAPTAAAAAAAARG
eukprot:RCo005527